MPSQRHKDIEILDRLGEWEQREGSLPQFVELYRDLVRLQVEAGSRVALPEPHLTQEAATGRVREGLPLLGFEDVRLDWGLVQDQFQAVTDILGGHLVPEAGDTQALADLARNMPLLQQVARDWYQGVSLANTAAERCVTEELLNVVIQSALRPFLVAHAEALLPLVKQELWRRRYCPICGGKADFAFLDKERGARWLLCSRCDTEWLFQRIECPYCGTQNQKSLSFLTDEQELYRLYTCEECRAYIKAIDLRKTQAEVLLPLERIVTADLDRQAEEAGYRPG
ncbi:MAG: hypothetical protein DRI39_04745 [Chloroflexi bacterium]|nr:MAG: hypothetical protein DRI39_04745 [Chloroflexota bacterium]RLC95792.1 MAG: hypothetical protein DRI40_04945 [Chloroflexota bacterium]